MAANVDVQNVNISSPVVHIDSQEPSTSTGHSFFDESLGNLRMIFPEKDVDVVTETLIRYEDPDIAAHALMDEVEVTTSRVELKESDEPIPEVLKQLRKPIENEGSAKK